MIVRSPRAGAAARAGFTLTEMLVVVAIIVVLAAIAIPITMGVLESARMDTARAHMKGTLVPAIARYRIRHHEPPETLDQLVLDPSTGLTLEALIDPWGRPYQYQPPQTDDPGDNGIIFSFGPNPNNQANYVYSVELAVTQ